MSIEARIVAHSMGPSGVPIFSVAVTAHRFILAEINTHRMLSRSYRSSRAVPVKRLLEEVRTNPAEPAYWGANQSGMQAAGLLSAVRDGLDLATGQTEEAHTGWGGEFTNSSPLERAQFAWGAAAKNAVRSAEDMAKYGLHKQIANRVLEPFLWVHGIITATEWDNFFGLRLHAAAQPEFRALADAMWSAMRASEARRLEPGEWHLPYADDAETVLNCEHFYSGLMTGQEVDGAGQLPWDSADDVRRLVSVARCARSSYKSFETGERSKIGEDLNVVEKLNIPGTHRYDPAAPIHASPAEHQATPDEIIRTNGTLTGPRERWRSPKEHGNFVGWRQYRKTLPGEAVAPTPEGY